MKSTSGISIRSIVAASALSGTFSRDISTAAPSLVVPSTALPLCVGHPAGKEGQLTLSLSHNFGPLISQLGFGRAYPPPLLFFSTAGLDAAGASGVDVGGTRLFFRHIFDMCLASRPAVGTAAFHNDRRYFGPDGSKCWRFR